MRARGKAVAVVGLVVVFASMLVTSNGCGGKPVEQKQLVLGLSNQYSDTLDIFNAGSTMLAHSMIYEQLVSLDTNYTFQPGLADSWETSADGLTWTFHLHRGVKFHDGSEFTADAVKWWFESMLKGVNSSMFESLTEARVVDKYTLALTFSGPFPNVLFNLTPPGSGIVSKEAYEKYGSDYGTKAAVGTGPFMLKEWVQDDHILLERNPDYNWAPAWTGHKGAAKVESILIRIIPEDSVRVVELQSGNVHLLLDPPNPQLAQQFRNNADYFYVAAPEAMISFIGMNVNNPFFADIRTRKAIGHAIDRQLINDTLYQGDGRPTTTYLCAELGGDKGVSQFAPSFDIAKAKSLLAEAGWTPGSDGILVASKVAAVQAGTRFEVPYWTYQDDEHRRLAEATQKMLADVGIRAKTQSMDSSTYSAQLKTGEQGIILRDYTWGNNDILEWFLHSKFLPYPNYLGVNDKTLDAMLDEANFRTPNWADRDMKYVQLHRYLIENIYPWAPIRQRSFVYIGRKTVKNFSPIPLEGAKTNIWFLVDLAAK